MSEKHAIFVIVTATLGLVSYYAGRDSHREEARAEREAEQEKKDRERPVGQLGELAKKCEAQGGAWKYERNWLRDDAAIEFGCLTSWSARVKP